MAKKVSIDVFFIGKTAVDRTEVRRWLDRIGVSADYQLPPPESVSDPALLIGLGGKRCYQSFEVELNPNLSKIRSDWGEYLDNVLASGHGSVVEHPVYNFAFEGVSRVFCYHPDTEVLTAEGWKPVAQVKDGEYVLTLNPATGQARWSVNHKLHSFEYSGPLYYWQNREDVSPKVTPDHTLWCCPADLRKVRNLSAAEATTLHGRKATFAEMLGKRFFVRNSIGPIWGCSDQATFTIGDHTYDAARLFEWLGWVATDGTIARPETGRSRVRINQRKPAGVRRLLELCDCLFGDRVKVTGAPYRAFDVSDPDLYRWVVSMIGRTNKDRDLLRVLGYSPRLVSAFLAGVYGGDGSVGAADHQTIHCGGNMKVAKQYQALVAVAGLASRVTVSDREVGRERTMPGGQTFVNVLPAARVEVHRRGAGACMVKAHHQRVEHYNGQVHCPQTDDGIVYVRANGKALWCGNTGEMNRHRAGWAISEGSMRFIRFAEDVPYWEPTSIQGPDVLPPAVSQRIRDEDPNWVLHDPLVLPRVDTVDAKRHATRILFERAFDGQRDLYRLLEAIWKDELAPASKFKGKKEITSLMRRTIGMGCATGGMWSGNLRAVRHVITMRAAPTAEEEILYVFSRVAKRIVEEEPLIFGDFAEEGGFWRPKYVKV